MTTLDVVKETLMMMGFTALIGFALAYLIKTLNAIYLFFSKYGSGEITAHYKAYVRSARIERARITRAIKIMDGSSDTSLLNYLHTDKNAGSKQEKVGELYEIAEMHVADKKKNSGSDKEMNKLFGYHSGKI